MPTEETKRALVVGLGVTGISTAVGLRSAGWTPVIVERAPRRRTGGHMIGMYDSGRSAAKRLGILAHLRDRASVLPHLDIDRGRRRKVGMSFQDLPGTPWMMLRGDVERAAYATLPEDVEIRYSTTPTVVEQDDDGVDVTLLNTADGTSKTERFALVVGADGVRSTVRSLVFGPHEDHVERLNYMVVGYTYPGAPRGLAMGQGCSLLEPDRSMWVFAYRDADPTVLFQYRTDDVEAEFTQSPVERVKAVYGTEPLGETLGDAVATMADADEVLFDSCDQVKMKSWRKGRVVLIGDSAWCLTLFAGMGVSAGLAGADLLRAALSRHTENLNAGLAEWERTLKPYVREFQRLAHVQRVTWVPDNKKQIRIRRVLVRVRRFRLGARLLDRFTPFEVTRAWKEADIVLGPAETDPSRGPARAA
ncbi:FAD-dependent monooxygenase [Amycolatopsis jiangsuensis]|uniref:2-polyprenyl-6-methoxyphenol hydroxylase-like FAD-dependent oxidoreductase n=1 Tax=Amycolatopsis jiangsuensis TaxID=1181879 RepID=A0A840J8E9_9PSEU|nr:FAD-dependent monooxygenase [Amycolatopsis jiangsuensis]MBB4689658.1 2-polyprenyl-6-methoxyphenol hydroxylase-like FAD-dependent oxidoreductase [Amycolatopsis jiangsuensis]